MEPVNPRSAPPEAYARYAALQVVSQQVADTKRSLDSMEQDFEEAATAGLAGVKGFAAHVDFWFTGIKESDEAAKEVAARERRGSDGSVKGGNDNERAVLLDETLAERILRNSRARVRARANGTLGAGTDTGGGLGGFGGDGLGYSALYDASGLTASTDGPPPGPAVNGKSAAAAGGPPATATQPQESTLYVLPSDPEVAASPPKRVSSRRLNRDASAGVSRSAKALGARPQRQGGLGASSSGRQLSSKPPTGSNRSVTTTQRGRATASAGHSGGKEGKRDGPEGTGDDNGKGKRGPGSVGGISRSSGASMASSTWSPLEEYNRVAGMNDVRTDKPDWMLPSKLERAMNFDSTRRNPPSAKILGRWQDRPAKETPGPLGRAATKALSTSKSAPAFTIGVKLATPRTRARNLGQPDDPGTTTRIPSFVYDDRQQNKGVPFGVKLKSAREIERAIGIPEPPGTVQSCVTVARGGFSVTVDDV